MSKVEQAVEYFQNGYSCSQAIFGTYAEEFEMSTEQAMKIASGFGGGMRMAGTCGAVSGAFMVLGLEYGDKEKTYEQVMEFTKRYKGRRGSVSCRDLLGHDLTTEDGRKAIKEKDLFNTLCPKLVRDAAEILEEMI